MRRNGKKRPLIESPTKRRQIAALKDLMETPIIIPRPPWPMLPPIPGVSQRTDNHE